jgi:methyltransferase
VYFAIVTLIVYAFMGVEAVRARRNEIAQRARGGIEPPGDVYAALRVAYPLAFAAMIGEGLWNGVPPPTVASVGAALFTAAKLLKWWAIVTLGRAWTFRVIVVPGSKLVLTGPYRHMRHPNYVAVIGELIAVALLTGALITGPIATAIFAVLIARRVAVEERALDAILRR